MPRYVDDVVVNPVDAPQTPARLERSLSELGLGIVEADWGDSTVTGTSVSTPTGLVLVDREQKERTISLTMEVREDEGVTLPEAVQGFQLVVADLQRGTFIRRDHYFGDFGPMLFRVAGEVSAQNFGGWQKGESPDVTLTMVADLAGYSTEEREEGSFTSAAGARHLIFTEEPSPGTAKGLWRGRITNEGEEDWRGLILSRECRYAPEDLADPTAQLHYLAKNLTPKGGAEVKTVEGAEVVQHSSLTAGWITILSSEMPGVGHMTHQGPRPTWLRVYKPGDEEVQLQLLWRSLGSSRWDELMPIVTVPVADAWMPMFLGTPRPEVAVLGEDRWEFKVAARAPGGSGSVRLRDVYPLSAEQYCVLREPAVSSTAEAFATKSPTQVISDTVHGGKEWKTPENAKASDDSRATCSLGKGGTFGAFLVATNFGFSLPDGAIITGFVGACEHSRTGVEGDVHWSEVRLVHEGVILEDYPYANRTDASQIPTSDTVKSFGGSDDTWNGTWIAADVEDPGFGIALKPFVAHIDSIDVRVDDIKLTVFYSETEEGEERVCFQTRSAELRSDIMLRQHRTDDVWGRVVPDGVPIPYVPSGGQELRPTRTIVIPSVGDLQVLPDSGPAPELSAETFSRDGYHFAREAAS